MASREKVLFTKDGVFIHTTVVASSEEDALVPGKVFITQKRDGIFIEWKVKEEDCKSTDTDWAVVDAVGYKNDKSPDSDNVTMKQPTSPKPTPHKYIINLNIKDLKSFKRSKPNLGWSYLIFILNCGTTYPALHFHQGGTKLFIRELEKHLMVKRSPTDSCLYLVREHDPGALSKSFDELELFKEQSTHVLNKFIHDPVNTTLGGFSKVTGYLNHLLVEPQKHLDPASVSALLEDDPTCVELSSQEDQGFEVVTARELPPPREIKRDSPVSPQRWSYHMDKNGRVENVQELKEAIFRGGVDPSIRIEIWKFLLGYYKWDSTYSDRTTEREKKVDDYFAMKLQWKSVTEEQEKRFSLMRDRKNLIDKDVTRTDRTHPFFQGDKNPNLDVLYDILMTYCMYNFDLGYVQGMSDLCAPIMVVMENEVDAFWCFAGFMDLIGHNFELDQAGMKDQLRQLNLLLRFYDPELYNHLESHDSSNMYFCFRWLLIIFKREFSFPEIMRLWEVFWTGKPCKNFQLFICMAILENEKSTLIDNNFGFTEILKHINDMSGGLELEDILMKSELIYYQLHDCKSLPPSILEILGRAPPSSPPVSPVSTSSSVSSLIGKSTNNSSASSPEKPKRPPPPQQTTQTSPRPRHYPVQQSNGRHGPGHVERVMNGGSTSTLMTPDDDTVMDDHLDVLM